MPGTAWLACPQCGRGESESYFGSACGTCGALLELRIDPPESAEELRTRFDGRRLTGGALASGVWRYRELVLPTMPQQNVVTFPEGNTPLIRSERLRNVAGCEGLLIKHEGMNPTGSFKDRGMTVAISKALALGAKAVACASTGNTSASLAAYAAIAGLPALVFVPAGKVATGKLSQTLAHGARVVSVRGSFDDCLRLLREASDRLGVYVVNSVNPFRLAGQRSIIFELLHQLEWTVPDWIVLPAGNLGNTSAFGEALILAQRVGLIDRLPRLASVQAAGAAPFAAAFRDGFRSHPTVEPETIATAIRIGAPASWDRAVRAIRDTNGVALSVSDDEILAAKRAIDAAGIGCEPASAASLAGITAMIRSGEIDPRARVVAVLTGHVLKDPDIVMSNAPALMEIDPTLADVERVLAP